MENKDQTKKGLELMDRFAMNVFIFFTEGKKSAAKASYHHLLGAATMYAYAIDGGEKTCFWFAEKALRAACELYGQDYDELDEFLEK